jgi:thioredoxin-like negative regulator of GroEL
MSRNNNPLSDEECQLIEELLAGGESHNSVAARIGRSQLTVSKYAKRAGITPLHRTPTEAIERRKEFSLEQRLEDTGILMEKVLEIARDAKNGRDIKECSIAWGVLCDKKAVMEGLPSSRTETHTTRASAHLDLRAEFERIDQQLEEEWAASQRHQAVEEE